jgi:hypothetical protein
VLLLLLLLGVACMQWGIPRLLRVLAVSAASLAVLTMNLPPVTAAPELWKGVGVQMG